MTTCTFQEFRPSISAVKIEGNLKRNELRILHYLIAFTYGRAEQSNQIFSYMAEQTRQCGASIETLKPLI